MVQQRLVVAGCTAVPVSAAECAAVIAPYHLCKQNSPTTQAYFVHCFDTHGIGLGLGPKKDLQPKFDDASGLVTSQIHVYRTHLCVFAVEVLVYIELIGRMWRTIF